MHHAFSIPPQYKPHYRPIVLRLGSRILEKPYKSRLHNLRRWKGNMRYLVNWLWKMQRLQKRNGSIRCFSIETMFISPRVLEHRRKESLRLGGTRVWMSGLISLFGELIMVAQTRSRFVAFARTIADCEIVNYISLLVVWTRVIAGIVC